MDQSVGESGSTRAPRRRVLGDFRADARILVVAVMAALVGLGGAVMARCLVDLIALVTNLVWFSRVSLVLPSLAGVKPSIGTVVIPVAGGLVIGLMARFGSEKIRGHGIPEAIEAILIGGSRMSPKVAVLKPVSSAVSIGTGGPFGAEGPIIMSGGAIGSLFGQFFHLTAAERKTLLVAGAAAGMAAIFGTPVAAVLLAVELLLFEWRPRSFIPVVAGVGTAMVLRPLLFGAGPLFPYSAAPDLPAWSILAVPGLGLLAGLVSGVLTTLLYRFEDGFERLPLHWMWWPALGGLAVGLGGLIEPRALGVGYDVIADLLSGHLAVRAVVLLLLVKSAIWLVSLASGTSGGVLAPLLIFGGATGWLVGQVLPGDAGFWALIGMAAMLGGTMRSPLTGALFAVELTGDIRALTPLLTASATAYAVTVLLLRRSILTEKIARRGGHVTRDYGVDPHELTRVATVMTRRVETLPADLPRAAAIARIGSGRHHAYPVVDEAGRVLGFASRADALSWEAERDDGRALGALVNDPSLVPLHPDDVTAHAIDVMLATGRGRLPVTDPASGALVGIVTRKDLLEVRAAASRAESERQAFFARRRSLAHRTGAAEA